MAEHITTLAEIREKMAVNDEPETTDLIYAQRGSGSDRDKAFQIDEISAKAMDNLGDDGDIEFSQYTAAGGVTRTKGTIQAGKIVGSMFASLLQMLGKTLRWLNTGFGTTQLEWMGLKFFKGSADPDSATPDYKFDNEGNVRLGKLIFNTTIGAQTRNGRTSSDYATMTSCETKAGTGVTPTEYLTAVYASTVGNDKFVLDSTKHSFGSVVIVTNTGECSTGPSNHDLVVYAASDTSYAYPLCEIPVYHSKMFRYCGTTQGTNYPIWLPIA